MDKLKFRDKSGNELTLDKSSYINFYDSDGAFVTLQSSMVDVIMPDDKNEGAKLITFKDFFGQDVSNINFK